MGPRLLGRRHARVATISHCHRGWGLEIFDGADDEDLAAIALFGARAATSGFRTRFAPEFEVEDEGTWSWWRLCVAEPVDQTAKELLGSVDVQLAAVVNLGSESVSGGVL